MQDFRLDFTKNSREDVEDGMFGSIFLFQVDDSTIIIKGVLSISETPLKSMYGDCSTLKICVLADYYFNNAVSH